MSRSKRALMEWPQPISDPHERDWPRVKGQLSEETWKTWLVVNVIRLWPLAVTSSRQAKTPSFQVVIHSSRPV